jgi:hypothetical protein
MKEVKRELDDIEVQQQELERQGVTLEKTIRDKFEQAPNTNDGEHECQQGGKMTSSVRPQILTAMNVSVGIVKTCSYVEFYMYAYPPYAASHICFAYIHTCVLTHTHTHTINTQFSCGIWLLCLSGITVYNS